MPFTSSSAVQSAIISWTNNAMTTAQAQDCMTLGEDRIYRELKVRSMETVIGSTVTSGVVSVPSGYVELRNAYVDGTPVQALQRKAPDWIYTNYSQRSSSGKPKFIARDGANFVFGPYPDSNYLVYLSYYTRPATAVGGTPTGILLTSPGLWLFASLSESEAFIGMDQRIVIWEQKYQDIKKSVMLEDEREKSSGAPLAMVAG